MLHTDRRAPELRSEAPCCVGVQRLSWICNMGAGVRQVKRKLKSFTIKGSICLNWSLYPVTGIAGGVGCPSKVLLFQGTGLVMAEGDFLTECMSTTAFSYDHKKNNIMQEGDKFCSEWLNNHTASRNLPFWLSGESRSGDITLMEPLS